jgi:DMSO/TMAO reductase YedYZ molybdopterin-dependent catalytic subunit|tara:strand:- start:1428 stop:2684 length:1257 start_codon:yes stop_codon:yes gene_type:complete
MNDLHAHEAMHDAARDTGHPSDASRGPTRRRFLLSTAGLGAAAGAGAAGLIPARALAQDDTLPDYVAWKDADDMIVHSPQTLETTRAGQGARAITPDVDLFVRNNLPAPSEDIVADRDAWEVSIEGVGSPATMTLGELKTLGVRSVPTMLQCSGNGRAFFAHEAGGTQWSVGAAGNVIWTGVPLSAVVEAMGGPVSEAAFVTGTGGEELPDGLDPKTIMVERSVPLDALDRILLAFEMNGEPLPLAHGGPLRMVVPGYYGVNNVKYVKRVALTETESEAKIQQTSYRVRPVGVSGDPSQPSMYEMSVKSWVTTPLMEAATGNVLIQGVAYGGQSPLDGVEVSVDGGETWQEAEITGADMGVHSWRPFALRADLEPGTYTIASRAMNAEGTAQPEDFPPNERGYAHNGWRDHAVELTVS